MDIQNDSQFPLFTKNSVNFDAVDRKLEELSDNYGHLNSDDFEKKCYEELGITVDRNRYHVPSSTGQSHHTVRYCGSGDADPEYVALWECDCDGYKYHGDCKHITLINRINDYICDACVRRLRLLIQLKPGSFPPGFLT